MTSPLRLHTLPQACEVLGVSRQTLYRFIERGELVPVRLPGGERRITGLELERFVAETQRAATDDLAAKVRFLRERFSSAPRGRGRPRTATRGQEKASR